MKTFGYLERGTLIQEGTILQIWYEGVGSSSFQQVALFRPFGNSFSVELIPLKVDGHSEDSYSKEDLEDLLSNRRLVVYNQS